MQVNINITGLKELQSELKDFSDRRMKAAVATALTRTAKTVATDWQKKVNSSLDRPTDRTKKAVIFQGAEAAKLESRVFLKDRMQGTTPAVYLAPQEFGGNRLLKKFEQALASSGAMPSGYLTVPGKHAKRDAYGNVARAELVAVIRSLGSSYSPGYQQVISRRADNRLAAQRKSGRQFVAVGIAEAKRYKLTPGIYERQQDGSRKAIFLFKKSVSYKKRLGLVDRTGLQEIQTIFSTEIKRSIEQSLARLAAKRAAA
jgi:hypothetical protein